MNYVRSNNLFLKYQGFHHQVTQMQGLDNLVQRLNSLCGYSKNEVWCFFSTVEKYLNKYSNYPFQTESLFHSWHSSLFRQGIFLVWISKARQNILDLSWYGEDLQKQQLPKKAFLFFKKLVGFIFLLNMHILHIFLHFFKKFTSYCAV